MKKIAISIFVLLSPGFLFAQNPFRIKITDAENGENIKGAYVYVNEMPASDKYSDSYGVVNYNNLPKDRRVVVNVKKEGYKTYSLEVLASPLAIPDNFLMVKLERNYDLNKIIVYGQIADFNNRELPNTKITLSFLGQSIPVFSDSSGNFRFEIDKSKFHSVKSFTIQADPPNCESYKSNEDYYGGIIINKNIVVKCKSKNGTAGSKTETDKTEENNTLISDIKKELPGTWVGNLTQIDQSFGYSAVLKASIIRNKIVGTIQIKDDRNPNIFATFSIEGNYDNTEVTISEISISDLYGTRTWCMKEYIGTISTDGGQLIFSGSWNNDSYKTYDWGKISVISTKCQGGYFTLKKLKGNTGYSPNDKNVELLQQTGKDENKGSGKFENAQSNTVASLGAFKIDDYINNTGTQFDLAVLVIDSNNRPENSITTVIANLYRSKGHTVTTSLFTNNFFNSSFLNDVQGANTRALKKLQLASQANYIVIGKYSSGFDNGDITKWISRATLEVTVISCISNSQSDAFTITVSNGFDDKPHAEIGAIEKLKESYKASHLNL